MSALIHLKLLLPGRVFLDEQAVERLVVSTDQGSLGVYPRRQDFVAALAPGILTYQTESQGETYLAVDRGIIVKTSYEVLISAHSATKGEGLGSLKEAVEKEILTLDEIDSSTRTTLRQLETDMFRRIMEFRR